MFILGGEVGDSVCRVSSLRQFSDAVPGSGAEVRHVHTDTSFPNEPAPRGSELRFVH